MSVVRAMIGRRVVVEPANAHAAPRVTDVCYPQQALKKSGQYNRLRVSCVLPAWSSRSRRLAAPRASSAPGP